MRFWQKIFISTLLLFIIAFNAGSYILVSNNHRLNYKLETDRGIYEHSVVRGAIQSEIAYKRRDSGQVFGLSSQFIQDTIRNYAQRYGDDSVFFELLREDDKSVIFNNFMAIESLPEREELIVEKNTRNHITRDIGRGTYLFVSGILTLEDTDYIFTYIRDITDIYTVRNEQIQFFMLVSIVVSIAVAFIMILVTIMLTRPIKQLTVSTRIIANGIYSERANVNSHDEIGELSSNFNHMAEAVEANVIKLERAASEKQKFIENFTHELKTPLTSVIGYAEILRSAKVSEQMVQKAASYIYSEGKRLEALSIKLMDLILLQKENLNLKPFDLKVILSETAEVLRPKLDSKNQRLEFSLRSMIIDMEKDLLKTLIINLVDNASKASAKGGKIRISIMKDNYGRANLEVRDWGRGIPKDELSKITAPFYMVDKARTREEHGAGLGLSICAEIVRLHNGKMTIKSKEGKGSAVIVAFPHTRYKS